MFKILFTSALLLGFGSAHAAKPIDETRELAADGILEVHNVAGLIRVVGWNKSSVAIRGELGDGTAGLDIRGDRKSLRIEVKLPKRSGFGWWGGGSDSSATLEIQAPIGAQLRLNGVSADVEVRGHGGERLRVDTVSGDVKIDSGAPDIALKTVSGDVSLAATRPTQRVEMVTVSGDVRATDVGGELELESVSGDQDISTLNLRRLRSELVSGDLILRVKSLAPNARINAESVSGEISMQLPKMADFKIEAESFSGDIESDFGRVKEEEYGSGKTLNFTEGKAQVSIELSTMSGQITLRQGAR